MNKELAELIGMHVGDGSLYKTKWCLVWEMRGGLDEKDYYKNRVVNLLKRLFDFEFVPKFRSGGKNGCFGVQTTNKTLIEGLLNAGFKPGTKTYTVRIPEYIIKSKGRLIKTRFIRGLFDTDGCIRFGRINKNKLHTYPRIEFCFASKDLRDNLNVLFRELGFRSYVWGKNQFSLCLAGINNLEKFMKEVSPKNEKHINKYKLWKKYGYYLPRSHSGYCGDL